MRSPNSSQPLIDLAHLEELAHGHAEEMADLVRMYLETTQTNIRKLRAALKKKDMKRLRDAAHAAAGTSALMGIHQMSGLLQKLEECAFREDPKGAHHLLPKLEALFHRVSRILQVSQRPSSLPETGSNERA